MDNPIVTIAGITQPRVAGINSPSEFIAYCARISNPNNQTNTITMPKLLLHMVREHHWSPFEMVHVVVEITTTRDIARQILRHRSFSFQEFSQRYAEVVGPFSLRECRLQDTSNRQSSVETSDEELIGWWERSQLHVINNCKTEYRAALDRGIAKEVARAILPEGLSPSSIYMAGTLRSWMHYVWLRSHPSTQKEHRKIAILAADIISKEFDLVPIKNFVCADQPKDFYYDPSRGIYIRDCGSVKAVEFRKRNREAWLYNPWTGELRDLVDVGEDPYGYYITEFGQ